MSEDECINDPQNDLLNLDSEVLKPLKRRSSYYDNDSFVEPWDQSQQNFLQLSPKLKDEPETKKTKQIKIKVPQSRAKTRQKSIDTQTVQYTLPIADRVNSCHAQFQDFGMQSQNQVYQKIVQKILTTTKKQNKNKQIILKVPAPSTQIKQQVIQIKQKVPFSWSDYYKFIQKNNTNQIQQVKNFHPHVTGYNMNKSLQQRVERDSIFKNFRLKQTRTIV